jgi:hypothetical protein
MEVGTSRPFPGFIHAMNPGICMRIVGVRHLSALFLALLLLSTAFADAQAVSQQGELTSSPGFPRERFGSSVSIGGDVVVVGGPNQTDAAFVFTKSGCGWTQAAGLTATNARIGYEVAISGDGRTIAVTGGGKGLRLR